MGRHKGFKEPLATDDDEEGEGSVFRFDQLAPLKPLRITLDERRRLAEIELERMTTSRDSIHGTPQQVRDKAQAKKDRGLTETQCAALGMKPRPKRATAKS